VHGEAVAGAGRDTALYTRSVPELPEVQALAERMAARLHDARLAAVEPISFAGLKTFDPPPESLIGRPLSSVGRRGKFVILAFGGPRVAAHLSQGGRIDLEEKRVTARPKGGVVRFRFDRDPAVLLKEFGTERKAGWWVLAEGDDGPLTRLGIEPFSAEFAQLVMDGQDRGHLHALLRDQRRVAGIGRGYADDILHRAKLSPFRSLATLGREDRQRFLASVRSVLEEGLAVERRRTGGLPTKLGDHWIVHNRAGTPCPVCGDDLRRISYESHDVTYCPSCQTGGKILADRRLSRLIR
jgi:formamidopyrimidine-DNA glycosylase